MVSKDTLERIAQVLLKHLSTRQVHAVIKDLNSVPGNKSFRDTVEALQAFLRDHKNE